MSDFFNLSGKELLALASAVSFNLISCLTVDEQNTLGNFLQCVGQNILMAAGQTEMLNESATDKDKN